MRLFIAINLTTEVQQSIEAVVAPVRTQVPSIRWVPCDRLHVTVKFLGEQEPASVAGIRSTLTNVARPAHLGLCRIAEFGVFPNFRSPRVVWMGVQTPGLVEFAAELDNALATIGVPREGRGFAPHLTLGREAKPLSPRELDALRRWGSAVGAVAEQEIPSVDLMHSEIRPGGPAYSILSRAPLGGAPSSSTR